MQGPDFLLPTIRSIYIIFQLRVGIKRKKRSQTSPSRRKDPRPLPLPLLGWGMGLGAQTAFPFAASLNRAKASALPWPMTRVTGPNTSSSELHLLPLSCLFLHSYEPSGTSHMGHISIVSLSILSAMMLIKMTMEHDSQ